MIHDKQGWQWRSGPDDDSQIGLVMYLLYGWERFGSCSRLVLDCSWWLTHGFSSECHWQVSGSQTNSRQWLCFMWYTRIFVWLVVWNCFYFPRYITKWLAGWRVFFMGLETTNQLNVLFTERISSINHEPLSRPIVHHSQARSSWRLQFYDSSWFANQMSLVNVIAIYTQ